MGRFFGRLLAVLVGLTLFTVFFLTITILIIASGAEKPELKDNSILKLELDKPIYEMAYENPLDFMPLGSNKAEGYGLVDIRHALIKAAADSKIKAVLLKIGIAQTDYAQLQELRTDIENFKKSGKKVYAYSEYFTEGAYYLASVADKVYMPNVGYIEFNGLNYTVMYFKGTLDKLEIKPEIFKAGVYKSAVEPFLLDKMSDPNREQTTAFINSLNETLLSAISKSRKIDLPELKMISDSMWVHNPTDAKKFNLIDELLYKDQVEDVLQKELKTDKVNYCSLDAYFKIIENEVTEETSEDKVAVVVASGDIVSGKGSDDEIGDKTFIENLRKARDDKHVKAIVLRINSPGGSSLASDLMWREIMVAKTKKPVIASMSGLAASGGYYMSMPCDYIYAQENTITGSIGVFGMWFNTKDFMKNKLGVTTDGVKTGGYSDLGNANRPLTARERMFIQAEVDSTYKDFVSKAAQGRKRSFSEIETVASGRVWTGKQALQIGLVDALGGLEDAVAYAAKVAKLKNYHTTYIPEKKDFIENIKNKFEEDETNEAEEHLKSELGELFPYFKYLQKVKKFEGLQARMPDLIIE